MTIRYLVRKGILLTRTLRRVLALELNALACLLALAGCFPAALIAGPPNHALTAHAPSDSSIA